MRWRFRKLDWSYGLGELIIVIAGVLIALAVDQWNSDRMARVEEGEIIEQLISDLNTDVVEYELELSDLDEKEASLRRVRSVLASSSESVDDPAGLLRDVIQGANRGWNQTEARRTTFNELLGSGKFSFIRDAEIRVKIADYYDSDESAHLRIDERETQYPDVSYLLVPRKDEGLFETDVANRPREPDLEDSSAEKLVADVFASSLSNYINGEINLTRFIRNLDIRLRDERLDLLRALEAYRETIQ